MNLKAITARKTAQKEGLEFWVTIMIENHTRHIYSCHADFRKGDSKEAVARKFEDLARQIRDV